MASRTEQLSSWSEGTLNGVVQVGGTLRLERTYRDFALAQQLSVNADVQESSHQLLLTLHHPASVNIIPAHDYTVTTPGTPAYSRTVHVPGYPGMAYTVGGKIAGYTVWQKEIIIPPQQESSYVETVPARPPHTRTVHVEEQVDGYKDNGVVQVSGRYTHSDPAEKVSIFLGDREIASGYDMIEFAFNGTAADCRNTVQDIKNLPLLARNAAGALSAQGFRRTAQQPKQGTWLSPVLQLGPYDDPLSFTASLLVEGKPGNLPGLVVRSGPDAQSLNSWSNRGLNSEDRFFQFLITLEPGQVVKGISWTCQAEFGDVVEDHEGGTVTSDGFGLSYVPRVEVNVGGKDVSDLFSSVGDGQLVLGITRETHLPELRGSQVSVLLDGEIVDSGTVAGLSRKPSSGASQLEITYLRTDQLLSATTNNFPAGMAARDTNVKVSNNKLVTIGQSALSNAMPNLPFNDEGGFLLTILGNSPGQAKIIMDTVRSFRTLNFWQDTQNLTDGTGGLAFQEQSEWMQHYGENSRVGMSTIEQVCHANMMSVFGLEDGNLLVSELIPVPKMTLPEIVQQKSVDGKMRSSAYLRFHDEDGKFVPDYRLYVPDRRTDVSDISPLVEVVGTSGPAQINTQVEAAPVYLLYADSQGSHRKEGRIDYSNINWPTQRSGSSQTFSFVDSEGRLIAIRPGSEQVDHQITGSNGQWDVKFEFITDTIPYQDMDNDGNAVGDWDDVTGYTGVKVTYQQTDYKLKVDISLVFMVTGEYLVNGEWQTKELRGKANATYAPAWYPNLLQEAGEVRRKFGFEVRTENNPYVVSLKSYPPGADAEEQNMWETLPDRLATALTLKEALQARAVDLTYCGNPAWMPNQFVVIAKPPEGGYGAPITAWEVYLTLQAGRVDIQAGGEVKTTCNAAYLGTVVKDGGTLQLSSTDPTAGDWFN